MVRTRERGERCGRNTTGIAVDASITRHRGIRAACVNAACLKEEKDENEMGNTWRRAGRYACIDGDDQCTELSPRWAKAAVHGNMKLIRRHDTAPAAARRSRATLCIDVDAIAIGILTNFKDTP
jgi:hypothetical protein